MHLLPYLILGLWVLPVQAGEPKTAGASIPRIPPGSISIKDYSADLMQLYRESRLEDPRVLASYSRAQSSKEQQREAFGGLLPQISAYAGTSRIRQATELTEQVYNSENYSLNLSQHLYNKSAWENYQKFRSLARQSVHESRDAEAEAAVDLAQRYFAALAADDELELVQVERRATQKNLDRIIALFKKRLAMITDKLDIQARVDLLAAQEVDARNQVRVTRAALSEIIGRPVKEKLRRVRDDVQLQVSALGLDSWVQSALLDNPQLQASQNAVEAAGAALRAGKGEHYPTVSLNLSAQNSNEGYNSALAPRTDSYVAGIGVQVPIYSGGSVSARVRSLYQDQLTSVQQLEAIRRQVIKETTNAYLTADSSVEKVSANRNALTSAEQSSNASQKAFSYGVVNAVDVMISVQNEFMARRNLLKTQYDFITNLLILNRWAGMRSDDSIEIVNAWLSIDGNAVHVRERSSIQ